MPIQQKSINMNGEWKLAAALDMTKFQAETAAFLADTTMGLARNEQKKTDLRVPIVITDRNGSPAGKVLVYATVASRYDDLIDYLEDDFADVWVMMGGTGATGAHSAEDETWTGSFSCKKGEDTFQLAFHKENIIIQNYSTADTVTALETYFATRPDLAEETD